MSEKLHNIKILLSEFYVVFLLVIAWLFFGIFAPGFLSFRNILGIITFSVILLAASLAQNVVILVRGFDLTVGSIISLVTCVLSVLMVYSVIGSIIVAILLGGLIGFVNGFCTARLKIDPFLATLSMMFLIDGINLTIRPSPGGWIDKTFADALLLNIQGFGVGSIIAFLALTIFCVVLLEERHFGRLIYAVGGAEDRAILRGINTQKVKMLAYVVSCLLCTFGGLYMAAFVQIGDSKIGLPILFASVTAVLLGGTSVSGGTGRSLNTVAATLIISSITNFLFYIRVIEWWKYVFNGALLILAASAYYWIERRRER